MCFKIKIRSLLYYFGIYKNYLRYPETGRFDTKSFRYELKQWNYTKNFDHFNCGLRVNKNDVLDPLFSKQVRGMKPYSQIDWINLYRNDLHRDVQVSKRPVNETRINVRVARERRRKSACSPVLSRLASLATSGELTRLISCALG